MVQSKKSRSTGAANAQAAPQSIILPTSLVDHLKDVNNVYQDRLMLRSWFMAQVLQGDSPTTSNPCSTEENVYLYELLDDFLSDLIENALSR